MFAAYCRVVSLAGPANIPDSGSAGAAPSFECTKGQVRIYRAYFPPPGYEPPPDVENPPPDGKDPPPDDEKPPLDGKDPPPDDKEPAPDNEEDYKLVRRLVAMALGNSATDDDFFHPLIVRAFRLGCLLIRACKQDEMPLPYHQTARCQKRVDETDEKDPVDLTQNDTAEFSWSGHFFTLGRTARGDAEVAWPEPDSMEWSVFKFQRETMRELWTQECMFEVFCGLEDYIRHDSRSVCDRMAHLNGDLSLLAVPASDTLLATPVYVSEITKSSHTILDQLPKHFGL
jgi:hypothetical protein